MELIRAGRQAIGKIMDRAIIKDPQGGIRVDGIDVNASEMILFLETAGNYPKSRQKKIVEKAVQEISSTDGVEVVVEKIRDTETVLR